MNERRKQQGERFGGPHAAPSAAEAIRESLLVQRRTGTVSAVEFLKSNGVGSETIRCVLAARFSPPRLP